MNNSIPILICHKYDMIGELTVLSAVKLQIRNPKFEPKLSQILGYYVIEKFELMW